MTQPLQLPMFLPKSEWKLPSLGDLPSWAQAERVALDIETCDPQLTKLGPGVRRDGFICGVAFAIEDGPAAYMPFRHQHGTNLPTAKVLAYLRDQAAVFKGDLVGANLPYDVDYLLEAGVEFKPRFFRDVQVAEPLLDELQMHYNLDAIAERHGIPGKDIRLLKEAAEAYGLKYKSDMWRLPPEYVGAYAEQDVRLPLKLLRKQERMIDDQDLWQIYDLESQVLPVLTRMRRRGVRISFDQLDRVEQWSLQQETSALARVHKESGVRVAVGDVWKAGALARVLTAVGVEVPVTPKTKKPSITAELLDSIEHPVAALLKRARKVNKVRSTFVESIRRHAVGDRIHCTFRQLRSGGDTDDDEGGGRFGRLSSSDPNLQQQPARDPEIGPLWRAVYIPDDDLQWACLDYSQQEPRWLTHYAFLTECIGAAEAARRYRENPDTDNHQMMADLCHIARKPAKEIFLGKCYGMGGAKLCRKLLLPTKYVASRRRGGMVEVAGPEGQAIIEQFDRKAPYVTQLSRKCEEKAARTGFIRTVLGRKCRFPQTPEGFDWTYKALNRLIQGSSADQTKKAIVEADAAGIPIQLQVHDELDLSLRSRSDAEPLAQIMTECVPCEVPMKVDIEFGPDWGHIE